MCLTLYANTAASWVKEFTISSFTIYYLPDNKPSLAYAEDGLFIYYLIHLLFNLFTISSFTIYYLILRLSYTPSSHHQIITSSNLHIITSSHHHIITSSHHLIFTLSHHLIFTLSNHHIITLSHHILNYLKWAVWSVKKLN